MSRWTPINEDDKSTFPLDDRYILLSFANFSLPCVGRYEEDENGGAFYIGDDDEPLIKHGMVVNAWMELPKCYSEDDSNE